MPELDLRAGRGLRAGRSRGFRIRHAYEQLREMIIWGSLPPGTRLVGGELEEQLGVSRTPIRSALNRLVAEGYVVSSGGTKEFLSVAPLTQQDAAELFEMVGYLESIAARKAALLSLKARTALVARLRGFNREIAQVARSSRPSSSRIFDLDLAFHRTLIEAGAGPRLRKHLEALKPQVERYDRLYISAYFHDMHETIEEHERIARVLRAGEPDAAEKAVQRNWHCSAERLATVIARAGDRGTRRPVPSRSRAAS
jgi:DNA-binding GntR family transcriptional regulator